jgi:hypothetical protein
VDVSADGHGAGDFGDVLLSVEYILGHFALKNIKSIPKYGGGHEGRGTREGARGTRDKGTSTGLA